MDGVVSLTVVEGVDVSPVEVVVADAGELFLPVDSVVEVADVV